MVWHCGTHRPERGKCISTQLSELAAILISLAERENTLSSLQTTTNTFNMDSEVPMSIFYDQQ